MAEYDKQIDGAPQKDIRKPSYTVTELLFTDEKGRNLTMSYIRISGQIGDFSEDFFIQGLIAGITPISDAVFPTTQPGGSLHDGHIELVHGCNSLAVIRPEGSDAIVGFHLFDRGKLGDTEYTLVNMHAAGVLPEYQGGRILQKSREELLCLEDPDIAYGSTIHPAVYISYERIAEKLGYTFFPTSTQTPQYIVALVRQVLLENGGERSANSLDETFVKRDHLPVPVQGEIPYIGFSFFENDLHVNPTDGVALLLIKPEVQEWAEKEFGFPRQRTRPEN